MTWIFPDETDPPSVADRERLVDFLSQRGIQPQGHFKEALQDSEGLAWRYPAYAVKCFPMHEKLAEKLRLLCEPRGTNPNDIERNYQNQLVEFHALYALAELMEYEFVGWDVPSGKQAVAPGKNCDLALVKNGGSIFADAKDCSSELLSQYKVGHEIDGQVMHVTHYTPKVELPGWMAGKIRDADKKGADILVCHVPGWGLEGFDAPRLKEYGDAILPGVLAWTADGPVWSFVARYVRDIIIVKRFGCFVIRLDMKEAVGANQCVIHD